MRCEHLIFAERLSCFGKGKGRVDTSSSVVTDLSATEIRICQHSFVGSFAEARIMRQSRDGESVHSYVQR